MTRERAVRGRAEKHGASDRVAERVRLWTLHQGEDAAPEPRAHDPGAVATGGGPRPLDDGVDDGRGDLEVVPQAAVRFVQQLAHPFEVAVLEDADELVHA